LILQNCRNPKDEIASSAVERDADTTLGSRGRREHTVNLGIMARSSSLRAGNNDVGAVIIRVEEVSKLKCIDSVIERERNLEAPGRAKIDGLRNGIHQHHRAAFDRLGTDLWVEEKTKTTEQKTPPVRRSSRAIRKPEHDAVRPRPNRLHGQQKPTAPPTLFEIEGSAVGAVDLQTENRRPRPSACRRAI